MCFKFKNYFQSLRFTKKKKRKCELYKKLKEEYRREERTIAKLVEDNNQD